MYHNVNVQPDEKTKIGVHHVDGGTVWLDVTSDGSDFSQVSILLSEHRTAERVLVAAEEAHRTVTDTGRARTMAEAIAVALHEARFIPSAIEALGQNDAPAILVDGDEGRSFVVSVREV